MKSWIIGVLTAALVGAVVGAPVCFAGGKETEPDGATLDLSLRHTSPVVISSTEITSFLLRFEFNQDYEGELQGRYPSGRYELQLKKTEEGALCRLEYGSDRTPNRVAEFPVSGDALSRLDALLKERNVAQIDGHALQNSALGDSMYLEVAYADGESIYARGEGGGVKPDPDYYREEWFIDFFRALGREYGYDTLGPALKCCSYTCGGGMAGGHLYLTIRTEADGTIRAKLDSQEYNGAPRIRRELVDVPREKLDELAAFFSREDIFRWAAAPKSDILVLDADQVNVDFDYDDNSYATLFDYLDMPRDGFDAMQKIRAFLLELLKDAPEAEIKEDS